MTEKKISFGFKQIKKQPLLLPTKIGDTKEKKSDIELIQCLEGQTIKLINEKEEDKPLVIPLLNSQKTSSALASLRNLQNILNDEEQNDETNNANKPDTKTTESTEQNAPMTIEEKVVKELLNEAKNMDEENFGMNGEKLTLPIAADKLTLDGAKESSIDDYDSIPIAQFGMAMLRGMGLKDEEIISKKNKDPELRPKGMGLGADKVVKKVKLLVGPAQNETLEIKKNAYVRILAGKNKDLYGQIEGLDDHACRVIVRLAVGGARETLNEFMVQPISKQEFQQYGKVINSAKYEEYKRKHEEKEAKNELKEEVKRERSKSRSISRDRDEDFVRSKREQSPRQSNEKSNRNEYESNSRQVNRKRERSRDRSRERSKRSPSYDRYKSKEVEHNSYKSRHDSRRSRSTEKYSHASSSSKHSLDRSRNRSKDDKSRQSRQQSKSSSKSSSSDSDSSEDSRHKRSHHKKSKKNHKKKTSKAYSSDDGRNYKKKTKKSKRQRSRSRGRR